MWSCRLRNFVSLNKWGRAIPLTSSIPLVILFIWGVNKLLHWSHQTSWGLLTIAVSTPELVYYLPWPLNGIWIYYLFRDKLLKLSLPWHQFGPILFPSVFCLFCVPVLELKFWNIWGLSTQPLLCTLSPWKTSSNPTVAKVNTDNSQHWALLRIPKSYHVTFILGYPIGVWKLIELMKQTVDLPTIIHSRSSSPASKSQESLEYCLSFTFKSNTWKSCGFHLQNKSH